MSSYKQWLDPKIDKENEVLRLETHIKEIENYLNTLNHLLEEMR